MGYLVSLTFRWSVRFLKTKLQIPSRLILILFQGIPEFPPEAAQESAEGQGEGGGGGDETGRGTQGAGKRNNAQLIKFTVINSSYSSETGKPFWKNENFNISCNYSCYDSDSTVVMLLSLFLDVVVVTVIVVVVIVVAVFVVAVIVVAVIVVVAVVVVASLLLLPSLFLLS